MLIRVGDEITLELPQPSPVLLMLYLHPPRAATTRQPFRLEVGGCRDYMHLAITPCVAAAISWLDIAPVISAILLYRRRLPPRTLALGSKSI